MILFPSELILGTIPSKSTIKNWNFETIFGKSSKKEWLPSQRLKNGPNLKWNSLDLNTTIKITISSYIHDNFLGQFRLQPKVNFNQPPYTYNAQTITDLIKIFFSQHNLFTNLSLKNRSSDIGCPSRENQTYLIQRRKWLSKHRTNNTLQNAESLTTLLDNCNS